MKNLTLTYVIALTIIALVVGASQYMVQRAIATSSYDGRTINIAGRQSMLSQRITKAALAMETAESEEEFAEGKVELDKAYDLWELSHNALQYGNEALQLNDVNNSNRTLLLFLDLEPHYAAIKSGVENILTITYGSEGYADRLEEQVNLILANEGEFLQLMNDITFNYDNESSGRLEALRSTEYILLTVALGLLLLEAFFIFRPAISRIQEYTQKLIAQDESLKLALEEQKREKLKVDFLNKQAQSVFETVKQGLFLLDNRFMISDLYSSAMEEIFETKNIAGTNFLHLMRPRLVQRNQEALEMFVKHLFNPDIEEEVLAQLNPVEKVQLYTNLNDASIESRHVRISFARIVNDQEIVNVLVSVTDETDTITMQRKITESEERNKRESAQLLSILRVDPLLLRDFLNGAQEALKSISVKYEHDKAGDLKELLRFTFHTVHNLKGNATLIDLQLIVDKLHGIENIIVNLRDQSELTGGNFLKILYEVNDLNLIVGNMQRMLLRISEVNSRLASTEEALSNSLFVSSLEKGLRKMSNETGVPARFQFEDQGLVVPDRLKLGLKDIAIQLFRNSLVHGAEHKSDRIKRGKPEEMIIRIGLTQNEEDLMTLTYEDDGQGLDLQKIANKALANKLVSEPELKAMKDDHITQLIFSDGFSTADAVDHYAGRGQGLGLVQEIAKRFGGELSVFHEAGQFFRIQIVLPIEATTTYKQAI